MPNTPKAVTTKKKVAPKPAKTTSPTSIGTYTPPPDIQPPKKHWKGLLHMPEFYVLFFVCLFSFFSSMYLLHSKKLTPEVSPKRPVLSSDEQIGVLTKAIWPTFNGGFFTFQYPPTWQIAESTPNAFSISNDAIGTGKFFKNCSIYLQNPDHPSSLVAVNIRDRTSTEGPCWNYGYFFDNHTRILSTLPINNTIVIQKWMYPYPNSSDPKVQAEHWQDDYFQTYQFVGTNKNITFGLLNQSTNQTDTEKYFDEVLSTFTFVLAPEGTVQTTADSKTNNAKRREDLKTLMTAILAYKKDHASYPPGTPEKSTLISSQGAKICDSLLPQYLQTLPIDPSITTEKPITSCGGTYATGYQLALQDGKVTLTAPYAETESISVSE